ncbi:hypothetical protein [Roseivirga pacifica]|uniref:hypothetical protein n=1 Tax=Roseivirga pacifica TaxID=1267423 RepID=UPI003BAC983D
MTERLIENWLSNINERSFQVPFAFILQLEGFEVVHVSRHCTMEHGKDILAISPEGDPCAFQLKTAVGGKIKYRQWSNEILPQLASLSLVGVDHPAFKDKTKIVKPYFVTNGQLEEEVFDALEKYNERNRRLGRSDLCVSTYLESDIKKGLLDLKEGIWYSDFGGFKLLLESYLDDGLGVVDSKTVSSLISFHLRKVKQSKRKAKRAFWNCAVALNIAFHNYFKKQNHFSIVKILVLFLSEAHYFFSESGHNITSFKKEYDFVFDMITIQLESLEEEVASMKDEDYLLNNLLDDSVVFKYRRLQILSLICSLNIHRKLNSKKQSEYKELNRYIEEKLGDHEFFGESMFGCLVNHYWYFRLSKSIECSESLMKNMIKTIVYRLHDRSFKYLSPYGDFEDFLKANLEHDDSNVLYKESYYLECFVDVLAHGNHKQFMTGLWYLTSEIHCISFKVDKTNKLLLNRSETGKYLRKTWCQPQSWKKLREQSGRYEVSEIPDLFIEYSSFYPLFLIFNPHRINRDIFNFFEHNILR